jgi:hypothetical protein
MSSHVPPWSTLCMASKVYQQAAKIGDHEATSACMNAMEKMMPDFARRFPGRKPHEVVGRASKTLLFVWA